MQTHLLELDSRQVGLIVSALAACVPDGGPSDQAGLLAFIRQATGIEPDPETVDHLRDAAHCADLRVSFR